MNLWFLPFVREGLKPSPSTTPRAQTQVSFRLTSPGRPNRDVTRRLDLLGPGDVLGIETRQILRVTPASFSRDAEPDFFPSIEFDAPDLPWAYSPALPEPTSAPTRLLPWIALVVIEDQPGVSVDRGEPGQSPWLLRLPTDVARRELPDLADSWAWVHAQVACDTKEQIADTLANRPDRTLARLLAPRRLLAHRRYHACVVPTFRAGVVAGLGGTPTSDPTVRTGREPAWSATDLPRQLPVYHAWSFRTGDLGDFESLAQRLRPTPLDASRPASPLHLDLPEGDDSAIVDWEAPLRVPGSTPARPRRPGPAVAQIRSALRADGGTLPVLGPSYFGASWVDDRAVDPVANWMPELNLTPMWRAAAGLGAEAVRGEQEALVAAISEQLEAHRREQREGRRRQLAVTIVNRVKLRLANAPPSEGARVFAPLIARQQGSAANVGLFTIAGRRLTRKPWRMSKLPSITGVTPDTPPIVIGPVRAVAPSPGTAAPLAERVAVVPEINYRPGIELKPITMPPLPVAPVDATAIPDGAFAPRIARPMSEPLAARFPELMLPAQGAVPGDGVLLVESNPTFVEAFLVGANQELNHELLWRGLPADRRATAFRRFWGDEESGTPDEIDAITTWVPPSALGSHIKTTPAMVLLVRGELVRRYPSMVIAAVPAQWNESGPRGTRSPVAADSAAVLPSFRGRIGTDVLYAGFARPTLTEAIGTPVSTGPAGWFLLLSENPGDPRFGLDPDAVAGTITRANLSWPHLQLDAAATYAPVAKFPNVADAGFFTATATAANLASLVRQRAFRVFLHASLLVRPPN